MNRRIFLGLGVFGASLLSLGAVGLGLRGGVILEPSGPLRVLSLREYSIAHALALRVCHGPTLPSPSEIGVAERMDATLDRLHPASQREFKQALLLLENALTGLLLDGRLTAFTASSPEVQDRVLENWRTSALLVRRTGFKALTGLCKACYWSDPRTFASVGYPGPPNYGNAR